MPIKDPVRRAAYHKAYMKKYLKSPEHRAKHRRRVEKAKAARVRVAAALIAEFRSQGCAVCAEKAECCLDAHHVDPSAKKFEIANMVRTRGKLSEVPDELRKCVCLCKNCHTKLHAGLITLQGRGVRTSSQPS